MNTSFLLNINLQRLATIIIVIISILLGVFIAHLYYTSKNTDSFKPLETSIEKEPNSSEFVLKYTELVNANPKLLNYINFPTCSPYSGFVHYFEASRDNSSISILTVNNEVRGIKYIWPSRQGWSILADQVEGNPANSNGIDYYTQTIYFGKEITAEECQGATP
jgi:hypothetical protein